MSAPLLAALSALGSTGQAPNIAGSLLQRLSAGLRTPAPANPYRPSTTDPSPGGWVSRLSYPPVSGAVVGIGQVAVDSLLIGWRPTSDSGAWNGDLLVGPDAASAVSVAEVRLHSNSAYFHLRWLPVSIPIPAGQTLFVKTDPATSNGTPVLYTWVVPA